MSATKILQYNKEAMQNALKDVKAGVPVSTAAEKQGIPRVMLYYKKLEKYPEDEKIGAPTVLAIDEENALVIWMLNLAKVGFPVTKTQLLESVNLVMKKLRRPNNRLANKNPGLHWYELFINRHKEISERISQNLTSGRALLPEEKIRSLFQEIKLYFQEKDLLDAANDPTRVFNADETAFFINPKGDKVLVNNENKTVYNFISNDEKECVTTLVTGNAAGHLAPSMVIFKYERIPVHIANKLPTGFSIGKSESGWPEKHSTNT